GPQAPRQGSLPQAWGRLPRPIPGSRWWSSVPGPEDRRGSSSFQPQRVGIDDHALYPGAARQFRGIACGAEGPGAGVQHVADLVLHELEGQLLALDPALEPQDVPAETRAHDFAAGGAFRHAGNRLLDARHQLSAA